jgi:hypothetical protein
VDSTTAHLVHESERVVLLARGAIAASAKHRRLRVSLIGAAVLTLMILFVATGAIRQVPGAELVICPGFLIGGALLLGGVMVTAPANKRRENLLAVGLCPCCLCQLGGLEPEEDGCVICRRCRSAWAGASIGEPSETCRKCSYVLDGIVSPVCPECGFSRRGPLEAPRPIGNPVCARCGRDMRGREENRACPDCGAMYGIDYRE